MKKFRKAFSTLLLILILAPGLWGQPSTMDRPSTKAAEPQPKYAMLIRNINHLNAAIKTVDMLNSANNRQVKHFEVVICGREVAKLQAHASVIEKAKKAGITLSVCGMSMNKFSIDKNDLPQGVNIVPNGLIHIFDLQEQGYRTITL